MAPASGDARACAWCGRLRVELVWGHWICPAGCADVGHAPYIGHCQDCGAEYCTGNPDRRHQCERCARYEIRALVAAHAEPEQEHTGYMYRMRRDSANRRAIAIRDAAEKSTGDAA